MSSSDHYVVKVSGHDIHSDEKGEKFVVYRTEATRGDEKYTVKSRFSHFTQLDTEVRKAYKGNHLQSNIPMLPPKQAKFMVNHMDPEFIEERREDLERYLNIMSRIPNMSKVAAFTDFLKGQYPGQNVEATSLSD